MRHALRRRAGEDRDAGFTLIEILVAMVLMAIVMSSLAVFFIGAQKSSSALRMRQSATVVADAAMDNVHAIDVTKILAGRDKTSSDAQWAAPPVGVDLTSMTELYDTTTPAPASGFGATLSTDPTSGQPMGLPTVPETKKVNGTPFNVSYMIGQCYVPDGGGACTKTGTATSVRMDRIVVAVNWTIKGLACPLHICAYVIGSLLSPVGDPTFNVNQIVLDTTPPTIPTLNGCTQLTDQTEKLNAFSPSSDASGIQQYNIYRLPADLSTMTLVGTQTTTSAFTDTGLVPSTDYYYVVKALDTVGNISGPQVPQGEIDIPQPPYMVGPCTTMDDTTPPKWASPSTVTGTPTTSSILLSWPAATDDYKVQSYQVYRNGVLVTTVPAPTLSYNDTGLSPWVTYAYKIVAVDPAGNVSTVNNPTGSIKTIDNVKPTVPGGFTAVVDSVTKTTIDLDWLDSTDDVGVTGYNVCRSLASTMTSPTCATTVPSNYAFTGLTTNTHYWFTVSAYDGAGNTSSVATANTTTPDTQAPTVPAGLNSTGKTGSTVSLSWTAATDNIGVTGYRIYRGGVQVGTSATTTYTDSGLSDLTAYLYTVSAFDAAGNASAQSTSLSVTTLDGTPPTAPSLSSSAHTYTSITLNWTASTDNIGVTGYALYEDGGTTPITTTSASTFTFLDTGEAPGTTHTYVVKAFDAAGNYSVASNTLTVSTNTDLTPPNTPTLTKGTVTFSTVVLSWGAVSDNVAVTGYALYEDGGTTPITTTTGTTFTDTGESPATTHTYTVKAYDASGNYSAASNVVTVVYPLDPAAPTAVTLSGTSPGLNKATITWGTSTSTPTSVNAYKVYVNGVLNTTTAATTHSLVYSGLGNGATYTFYVIATNTAGKSSPPSNTLTCVISGSGTVTCS